MAGLGTPVCSGQLLSLPLLLQMVLDLMCGSVLGELFAWGYCCFHIVIPICCSG